MLDDDPIPLIIKVILFLIVIVAVASMFVPQSVEGVDTIDTHKHYG